MLGDLDARPALLPGGALAAGLRGLSRRSATPRTDAITNYLDGGGRLAVDRPRHRLGAWRPDGLAGLHRGARDLAAATRSRRLLRPIRDLDAEHRHRRAIRSRAATSGGVPYTPIRERRRRRRDRHRRRRRGGTGTTSWRNDERHAGPRRLPLGERRAERQLGATALLGRAAVPARRPLLRVHRARPAVHHAERDPQRHPRQDDRVAVRPRRARRSRSPSPNGGEVVTDQLGQRSPGPRRAGPGRRDRQRARSSTRSTAEPRGPRSRPASARAPTAGTSPASPNTLGGARARPRHRRRHAGALARADASNATSRSIAPGGDAQGPVVVAGSIAVGAEPDRAPEPGDAHRAASATRTPAAAARGGGGVVVRRRRRRRPAAGTPMTGDVRHAPWSTSRPTLDTGAVPDRRAQAVGARPGRRGQLGPGVGARRPGQRTTTVGADDACRRSRS